MATPSFPTAEQLNEAVAGYDRLYGLELLEFSETEVRARVAVREEIKQGWGWCTAGSMRRWRSR